MANTYANLEDLRNYLTLGSANVSDETMLLGYLNRASRSVDRYTRRYYYPLRKTRYYDYDQSQEIRLDDDMLSLDSLTTQNGASTVSQNALYLMTGNNYNRPPYDRIVLRSNSGSLLFYSGTDQQANQVTAFWGYHEDYSNAWIDTGTSLAGSMTLTDKSIQLAGAGSYGLGASDVNYEAPRMAIGDTLKIDGEIFCIAGTNGNSSPVVLRAQNGTSANNHSASTAIYRYASEPDIEWATLRLAAWLYGQQSTPYETKTAYITLGQISLPAAWGADIRDKLKRYIRMSIIIYPDRNNG